MKIKKSLIIGGIIVILAIVLGWVIFGRGAKPTEYVTAAVKTGALMQTVEVSGVLQAADKVDLAFNSSGPVSVLFVETGNQVQVGDLLGALDTNEAQAQTSSYAYAVEAAQANLDKELAGSTSENIAVYEAKVTSAKTTLSVAELDWNNQKATNEDNLAAAYEDLIQILKDNTVKVRTNLSEADNVLGIDNSMANDDYQDVLAANDWGSLQQAQYYYPLAKAARDQAEAAILTLSGDSDQATIDAATVLVEDALNQTSTTLLYVRRALDGTNVSTTTFTSTELITLEGTIDTARTAIETGQTALTTQEQAISQLKITNQKAIDTATGVVNKYADALAEAEAALTQTKAGPRDVDLAPLQAALAQARANYNAASARLMNAQIIAPISGQVTAVNFEVGELATTGATAITIQATKDNFKVIASVSETDITKIALNNSVSVTFDAFGEDKKFVGQVGKIAPAEKNIEGVVYYEVTVYLDTPAEAVAWKPGMTANLSVLTVQRDGVLLVPQRAVLQRADGTKYVRLPSASGFTEQDVTVGARGDDGWTEVLSGLTEEQLVITSTKV